MRREIREEPKDVYQSIIPPSSLSRHFFSLTKQESISVVTNPAVLRTENTRQTLTLMLMLSHCMYQTLHGSPITMLDVRRHRLLVLFKLRLPVATAHCADISMVDLCLYCHPL